MLTAAYAWSEKEVNEANGAVCYWESGETGLASHFSGGPSAPHEDCLLEPLVGHDFNMLSMRPAFHRGRRTREAHR